MSQRRKTKEPTLESAGSTRKSSRIKEPLLPGSRPITNKHYRPKPWLEKVQGVVDYLASDFLECLGGKILPMQAMINLQKGLMPVYCLALMAYFNNFSRGAWLYLTLHGSYGGLWILGYLIFPNKGFSHNITIGGCINMYATVLGPYCLAAYLVASRQIEEA